MVPPNKSHYESHMIIGKDFAWGHLGKTAGDATYQLFQRVAPDLVEFAHQPTERAKHQPFADASMEVLMKETLVLNIRRLPAWVLSNAQHRARSGTAADPAPQPLPPSSVLAESREADRGLGQFTANGRIRIDRWLRVEHLREDFLDFVAERRSITDAEARIARRLETKPPGRYDHDLRKTFTDRQIRNLYLENPAWAQAELKAYGHLPFQPLRRYVVVHNPLGGPRPGATPPPLASRVEALAGRVWRRLASPIRRT